MKCDAPAVGLISTHNYTLFTQLLSYVLIVVSSVLGFVFCLCICIYKKRKLDMKWFSENFLFMENINISTNVFSGVPASQFPWVTLLRESPIAKVADVGLFVVLAMVLRRKPDVLISALPTLNEAQKLQGQDNLPLIAFDALILHRDASTVMCSCICDAAVQNVDTVEGYEVLAHIESPSLSESPSSFRDQFWSAAVSNGTPIAIETADGNANSLYQHLKPTVSELCNILKFSESAKIVVERFLKFVVRNFNVSKEHTTPSVQQVASLVSDHLMPAIPVYESNHESTLAAGLIHGPCEVLPPSKFAEETGVRTRSRARGGDRSKTLFLSKCV
ncbi:P-loop containing nucleoside triphosphate hydrolase [Tanacetum coccineum]|uniref:P-loop containing nucleoside triphosphate hydrolase n=1 Tax=Tanacetum coccineum TaxID=301880 RepID=A0ABQ5BCY9_9ASTR